MRRKKIVLYFAVVLASVCCALTAGACGKDRQSIRFDDGDSLTLEIGDQRMLSFTAQPELDAAQKVELASSDPSVVEILGRGMVLAADEGTAVVTLTVQGTALEATIAVTVLAPQISAANTYTINADRTRTPMMSAKVGDIAHAGKRVFARAKKDDTIVGKAVAEINPGGYAYWELSDLGVTDGIFEVGLAIVGAPEETFAEVDVTDAMSSYSLNALTDWTFYNAEIGSDGKLTMINGDIGHGGASVVLDIKTDAEGDPIDRYISVSASEGNIWSVKIRRGDGNNDLYEEVILDDTRVSVRSSCVVDLHKYPTYVRGGKVTLCIYTVAGKLALNDVFTFAQGNTHVPAVLASRYKALEAVTATVPEKTRVGDTFRLRPQFTPADASFKTVRYVAENDCVTTDDAGRLTVEKPGTCKISFTGYDGRVYGSVTVNGTIAAKALHFYGTAGHASVAVADGAYDLGAKVRVLPQEATDKSVQYRIVSDTTETASVDGSGVIAFSAPGTVIVRATSTDNGNVWGEFELTVRETLIKAAAITLTADRTALVIGEKTTFTAAVLPAQADQTVEWISSDPIVVSVEGGEITALRAGTATIFAVSGDGAAFDSVAVTVTADKTIRLDPAEYGYGVLELNGDVLSGDNVRLSVRKGEKTATLADYTVGGPEQDVNGAGSMDAQRRILFELTDEVFDGAGDYVFTLAVERGGSPLPGYTFGTFRFGRTIEKMDRLPWEIGERAQSLVDVSGVKAMLTIDTFGCVGQTMSTASIADAQALLIGVKDRTADKISVKLRAGAQELTLTSGDCTSIGTFRFDLTTPEVRQFLNGADTCTVLLYAIGDKDEWALFENILFVTETHSVR